MQIGFDPVMQRLYLHALRQSLFKRVMLITSRVLTGPITQASGFPRALRRLRAPAESMHVGHLGSSALASRLFARRLHQAFVRRTVFSVPPH